jgi:4,5:9,10-diseco-3-hydroxy-5,9,17-trioxoandrosta-1(10),2-diene-4-oate hydrolase
MERRLTIDGTRLVLDDEGAGDPVVCLHAIGHDARDFARVRERLRDRFRVLAVDWPGQGRSPHDTRPPTALRYAGLVAGVLDALGIDACVLVGNSIGGAAALAYAAGHPARVRGLVLENPGGLAPVDDSLARAALAGMGRFFAAGARGARWFRPAFALYYRLVLQRGAAAAARARVVGQAYTLAPVLEQAWRGFASPEADLRGLVPRVVCPVLCAWAERDVFVALRRSLPAIRRLPNAELVRFPAGHAAHLETPEAFEAALERFLSALAPAVTASRTAVP